MKSVGLVGLGRFGKVLATILADEYHVRAYDPTPWSNNDIEQTTLENVLKEPAIFLAVPINQFKQVIESIANKLSDNSTVFDVCSIKIHPVKIMKEKLSTSTGIIATHPLFGPDSIHSNEKLNFMMHPVRDTHHCYDEWKTFFSKRFNIVEMTPDEHDKLAAQSQGVVHFVSRFLNEADLHETAIDTLSFKQLLKLVKNNCNDTWELFSDLQNYNPYSQAMIDKLESAFNAVKSKL